MTMVMDGMALPMIQTLQEHYDYIECQRRELLELYQGFRRNQLHFRPGTDQWSMLQVAQHLVLVERGMAQQASERLLAATSDDRVPWTSHVAILFLALTLPLPIRVTAPKQTLPIHEWDLEQVIKSWEQARMEWRALLEDVSSNRLSYPVVKHPIAGWLSLSQTMRFHAMHFDHHMIQVKRIQRDRNFPRA